ncbi:MAG: ribosome maturation factor RimP, partial [Acidimicrobiales bacterium]
MAQKPSQRKSPLDQSALGRLTALINDEVSLMELSVLELEVVGRTLRVTLEGQAHDPSLDEIAAASKVVSELLDKIDDIAFLNQRYELEVSSPGIERPLYTAGHFARHVGALAEIRQANGQPVQWRILGYEEDTDTVRLGDLQGKA